MDSRSLTILRSSTKPRRTASEFSISVRWLSSQPSLNRLLSRHSLPPREALILQLRWEVNIKIYILERLNSICCFRVHIILIELIEIFLIYYFLLNTTAGGVKFYNCVDKSSPTALQAFASDQSKHVTSNLASNYVFAALPNSLIIYDLTNPSSITKSSTTTISYGDFDLTDISISENDNILSLGNRCKQIIER